MHHKSQTKVVYRVELKNNDDWRCVSFHDDHLSAETHLAVVANTLQRNSQARILKETTTTISDVDLLKIIEH